MSDNLGTNFNKDEKNDLLGLPSVNFDEYTGGFNTTEMVEEIVGPGFLDFGEPLNLGEQFSFQYYWNN